ncbi:MAG: AAA family ATPase [Chloroflexi bacterium]|nr:AAA family ATPase [Chloroflexota bacterium]MCC6895157.1 AAA family ATPase [Anaerolineae bacterium]
MAEQNDVPQPKGITGITISGFKSLRDESHIEIRNLTILAGANSSGKSSIMQPLLLLKQTLEAPYDPGPLLLNGPNVNFRNAKQFFWKVNEKRYKDFVLQIDIDGKANFSNRYHKYFEKIELIETSTFYAGKRIKLHPNMTEEEIVAKVPEVLRKFIDSWEQDLQGRLRFFVVRNRCFLGLDIAHPDSNVPIKGMGFLTEIDNRKILEMIHVQGIRSRPETLYPITSGLDSMYIGNFENYTATIVNNWKSSGSNRFYEVARILGSSGLRLTSGIDVRQVSDTHIELLVNRLIDNSLSSKSDMVTISNVGFGVSQVLPVLVALLVAEPEQLVYIEQPELHLHPRAQVALAQIVADAANRGVRVVVETHSDLLLLGIQTLVAEGKLATNKVKLHWFERDNEGVTHITPSDLNEDGSYEGWPEDFADVQFRASNDYLDAVEKRQREGLNGH